MILLRAPTRSGLVLALVLLVVALPSVALGGAAAPAAPAENRQTYQDSTGENPNAPDITTIVVSNDDAGTITFRISVPNRPQYAQDMALLVVIDSDANQSTGDAEGLGADYIIEVFRGEPILLRWNGTDYAIAATQASLSHSWSGGTVVVRINASDLNNTRRLNFRLVTIANIQFDPATGDPNFDAIERDLAPTVGFYPYRVIIARPTLVVRRVVSTPARAGRAVTMRMTVARSDTNAVLRNGRVTCVGRAGNVRLRSTVARVQGGAVVCTWQLPANSSGRVFRGQATVVFEGVRATRSISKPIR